MGIGTLRRYHDDSRLAGLTPLDESAVDAAQEEAAALVGAEDELERNRVLNDAAAKLTEAKAAAFDAQYAEDGSFEAAITAVTEAQAAYDEAWGVVQSDGAEPTEGDGDQRPDVEVRGDPEGEESKGDEEPTLGEVPAGDAAAGAIVAAKAAEDAGVEQASTEELGSKHGDLEQPSRGASTAAWVAYAEADPVGAPLDLTPRAGLRDAIAAHYLGTE